MPQHSSQVHPPAPCSHSGVALLLLLFMSLLVLPVYALTTAAGSHSAQSVIRHALKHKVQPNLARALQRLSMQPKRGTEDEGEGPPAGGSSGHGQLLEQGEEERPANSWLPAAAQPPVLGRHSAPLPVHLNRLSPFGLPSPVGMPSSPTAGRGSTGGDESGLTSPFAASSTRQLSLDPSVAAAIAATAGASPPGRDADDSQRSITRLMGEPSCVVLLRCAALCHGANGCNPTLAVRLLT